MDPVLDIFRCEHGTPEGNICAACELYIRAVPFDAIDQLRELVGPDPRGDAWRRVHWLEHAAAAIGHAAQGMRGVKVDRATGKHPFVLAMARMGMAFETKTKEDS